MQQHTVQTPYVVGEVHFYSAELEGGLVLFDTGPPTPEGIACLQGSVGLARLKYLFITHCHVDHYGLADFIIQNSSAEVFIPRRDAIKFQRYSERMALMGEILNGYGFGKNFTTPFRESVERNKTFPAQPERFKVLEEFSGLAGLGISYLPCPGHSQSDLVYMVGEYAVTGDVLLRNIFQAPLLDVNFDTFEGRFRNYEAYCTSIINLARLRGMKIMPGHRRYVQSLDKALLFYVRTLLERSAQLLPLKELMVNQIINTIFQARQSDPFYIYLKISEVVFMLDFIENPALLKASLEQIGLFDQVSELYEAFM